MPPTIAFDGATKLITIGAEAGTRSTVTAAYLYSEWKRWVASRAGTRFDEAFAVSVGGNSLGGGSALDAYYFLRNDLGWRIKPDERNHELIIEGNLFGVDPNTTIWQTTTGAFNIPVRLILSSRSIVTTSSGDASVIAASVWRYDLDADIALAAAGDEAAGNRLTKAARFAKNAFASIWAKG